MSKGCSDAVAKHPKCPISCEPVSTPNNLSRNGCFYAKRCVYVSRRYDEAMSRGVASGVLRDALSISTTLLHPSQGEGTISSLAVLKRPRKLNEVMHIQSKVLEYL